MKHSSTCSATRSPDPGDPSGVSAGVLVGAPATPGAAGTWLGGLARGSHPGSHPRPAVARAFGIVGMVNAILEILAMMFGGPPALS